MGHIGGGFPESNSQYRPAPNQTCDLKLPASVYQSLIFPGVGAFETAIHGLESRGFLEPLRKYIQSGKPYFGICIGMQILFESSTETLDTNVKGFGIIPCPIESFDNADKAVPHMGWNRAESVEDSAVDDGAASAYYYFVHSYRARYDPILHPEAARFAHTTCQYGQEVFFSTVFRDNVFGCQFHPEKSGPDGLKLLNSWLSRTEHQRSSVLAAPRRPRPPKSKDGLTKRIIACMDVRANDQGDLIVTKGDQYDVREKAEFRLTSETAGAVRNLGKPVSLAGKYYEAGADELCLLNITSFRQSPLQDQPMLLVVRAAAECVYVPLTIGGGIKDSIDPDGTPRSALEVAGAYFRAGADKVSIGSEAVYAVEKLHAAGGRKDGTSAIETIAKTYGRQAVVVSIDPRRVYVEKTYEGPFKAELIHGSNAGPLDETGKAWWYQCTVSGGRESRPISAVQLAKGSEVLGAGEILVNSIDRDGTGKGFDLALVNLIRRSVRIPVVASSGAGTAQHFVDVFRETEVEAALAAGIFHREEVKISEVKQAIAEAGIAARLA